MQVPGVPSGFVLGQNREWWEASQVRDWNDSTSVESSVERGTAAGRVETIRFVDLSAIANGNAIVELKSQN